MKSYREWAPILDLIGKLRDKRSWCGATHVQKAAYLLQQVCEVDLPFPFVLHHYGPYSFELSDLIDNLQASGSIAVEPAEQYGPRFRLTPRGQTVAGLFRSEDFSKEIDFIAEAVGNKGVAQLEKLATAVLVIEEMPKGDLETWARRLNEIKPHVDVPAAREAVEQALGLKERWLGVRV